MDIDDLRIVTAVAKHGSMNRAAAQLNMVQSSVTARIRLLEEELGVPLFVRHSRGVRLSDAGERLLSFSDRIHTLFDEAVAAVKEDGVPKGALRIGSTEPTVSLRLPPVLAEYARKYPAVALTITLGNTSELIEQVIDQTLDGAFVAGPVQRPGLIEEPVYREDVVLVSQASTRSIDVLRNSGDVRALVLDQGCSYRDLLTEILETYGIKNQVLPLASFDAIRSCVESGVGVTLLPKELLAGAWKSASVAIHELAGRTGQVETVFIRRAESTHFSALNAFAVLSRASSNFTR
ncbi:LysR family transcriptional regulator [Silvibacterium sp.]|uniref:LysR family transcriptional regulator n=1 Tax=Silvibacterium sp. TaxID=1964179 RepID=UPI0039E4987F